MRKLKYHVACTIDGFIAHEDHTVEGFLAEGDHATEYLDSLKNDYEIVLMGRRTYEFGVRLGVTNPYPWLQQYVVSQTMTVPLDDQVKLLAANMSEVVKGLKAQEGKAIYLCGGAGLAGHLLNEQLIDEIILKLNPVVFGKGISLFSGVSKAFSLALLDSKSYRNGVLLLTYQVQY